MRLIKVFLFLAVLIVLVGLVSALDTCSVVPSASCPEANTTLKLSSETLNAHGALYNDTNYPFSICCNFEGAHNNSEGGLRIISLDSDSNAHATPSASYPIPIYFGNLNCSTSCTANYPIELLSLSGTTNAHLGAFDSYTTQICCNRISNPCIPSLTCANYTGQCGASLSDGCSGSLNCSNACGVGETCNATFQCEVSDTIGSYWATSSSGSPLSGGYEVTITDSNFPVMWMVVLNSGWGENETVKFEIKEDDLPLSCMGFDCDEDIRVGADAIIGVVDAEGNVFVNWTVTQADLNLTNDYDEFYFETNITDLPRSDGIEFIITEIDDCPNILLCKDYNDETRCENDENECGVAADSLEGSELNEGDCDEVGINCGCWWNSSRDPGEECQPDWNAGDYDDPQDPLAVGNCSYNENAGGDDCADGFLSYAWTANWDWDSSNNGVTCAVAGAEQVKVGNLCYHDPDNRSGKCASGNVVVTCPERVELPFFTFMNFIVALIAITLIYLMKNEK